MLTFYIRFKIRRFVFSFDNNNRILSVMYIVVGSILFIVLSWVSLSVPLGCLGEWLIIFIAHDLTVIGSILILVLSGRELVPPFSDDLVLRVVGSPTLLLQSFYNITIWVKINTIKL